jgi:hypothetical protein
MTIEPVQLARARRCRARTRSGALCRSPAVRGRTKCWRHAPGGALCGEQNGRYRSGRYTREARAVSKYFRQLTKTAETVVALAANRSGRKPPKMYRRRVHVKKALAELDAAKKAKEAK